MNSLDDPALEESMSEERYVPNVIKAFVTQEVKAVNAASREILHLITNATVDRAGDIVEPKGAEIANFMRNPIVMADHGHTIDKVVGHAMSIEVSDKGISARTKFRDTPLGREAFALAKEGLGGWSIGFRPINFDPIKTDTGKTKGFQFKQWELLEYSIVAIPCNPDVVQNAITRGLISKELSRVFFDPIEEPKPTVEAVAGDGPTVEAPKSEVQLTLRGKEAGAAIEAAKRMALSTAIPEMESRIAAALRSLRHV